MPTTCTSEQRQQRLPGELTDNIIDQLHSDISMLGVCGRVSSQWLNRSRSHIFKTVRLWPWRIQSFAKLATSKSCTFLAHVQKLELDDARVKPDTPGVPFNEAVFLAQSLLSQSPIASIKVCSVDWTMLSFTDQKQVRQNLSQFRYLQRLVFCDVTFHDLREVVNIVSTFPLLKHLSANVCFRKYSEHVVAAAEKLRLPRTIESLDLCTEDGVPVVLSSVIGASPECHVTRLNLRNLKVEHLPVLEKMVRKIGGSLVHLTLGLDRTSWETDKEGDLLRSLKLSNLTQLRSLRIEGLWLSPKQTALEICLPQILTRLKSPVLNQISLVFILDFLGDLHHFDWAHTQCVLKGLQSFGLKVVEIVIQTSRDVSQSRAFIEHWICKVLKDLDERGALTVSTTCM